MATYIDSWTGNALYHLSQCGFYAVTSSARCEPLIRVKHTNAYPKTDRARTSCLPQRRSDSLGWLD
jgi:hypothetical protein